MGKHIIVTDGDKVKRGDQITEGPVSPEDLLEACGAQELQEHLVNEVQSVYRVQGVEINDKHIEVIIRQMLRKVKITDPGDADQYLWGDQIDRTNFKRINAEIVANGGKPAEANRSCSASPRPRWKPTRSSPPHRSRTPPASSPKPPPRQGRLPHRLQGKRHHGPPHPRRHRLPVPPRFRVRVHRRGTRTDRPQPSPGGVTTTTRSTPCLENSSQ
jgi:hypothetical protein